MAYSEQQTDFPAKAVLNLTPEGSQCSVRLTAEGPRSTCYVFDYYIKLHAAHSLLRHRCRSHGWSTIDDLVPVKPRKRLIYQDID